jgi:hypothetical protein
MRECKVLLVAVFVLSQLLEIGCGVENVGSEVGSSHSNVAAEPESMPPTRAINPEILELSASALCARLSEIQVIDSREPENSDDQYRALIAKGSEALPCLVDKITDRKPMHDPRMAPIWQHYSVGDTAVFAILHIASKDDYERWKELMLDPLPPKYREEWKTNGVYAYFNYVSEPKNRSKLQRWWTNWLKQGKNEQ